MKRRLSIILIISVIVFVVLFIFWEKLFGLSPRFFDIEKTADILIGEIKKEITNPPPLRAIKESEQSLLTQAGTTKWTNIQRANNGLVLLIENVQLNSAALRKMQDMFSRQYFEHVSPDGKNISNLVESYNYEYIAVGENLALGNYKDDQGLVQAWMDSPGHRANILSTKFTEIGVAVGRGLFEGKQTWLAVQAFARPLSACPQADELLKSQINWLKLQTAELKVEADAILNEIDGYKKGNNQDEYNRKVEEYNALAERINNLVAQVKAMTVTYNDQVRIFNFCVTSQ